MQKPMKTMVAAFVTLISIPTYSGSFSLYGEGNGSATGNYAAGIAAEAVDASIGWYNPAGLALIRTQQAVLGAVGIDLSTELTGTSTFETLGLPDYIQSFNVLDGGKKAVVPSLHYALPLGENATFALSVVAPFGLKTNWSVSGPLRYAATLSDLKIIDVSPEIGGFITNNWSLGAGIDFQYARVKFNRVLGLPTLMQALDLPPNIIDSESFNQGDSFGVGFHAGILGLFNDNHTRLGLNYQSKVTHTFHGISRLSGRLASPGVDIFDPASILGSSLFAEASRNDLSSNTVDLPDIITLSLYQDINPSLALLGSIVYTGWDTIETIELNHVTAYAPPPPTGRTVPVNSISPEYYRNAWRFALGANYHLTDKLMIRAGGGYDQTPTTDLYRSIRVPDANRWAAAIGAHYQAWPNIGLDVGYTHLFGQDSNINRTDAAGGTSTYTVNAAVNAKANLVGVQLTWLIDQEPVMITK